jgi:hypothetical protein
VQARNAPWAYRLKRAIPQTVTMQYNEAVSLAFSVGHVTATSPSLTPSKEATGVLHTPAPVSCIIMQVTARHDRSNKSRWIWPGLASWH